MDTVKIFLKDIGQIAGMLGVEKSRPLSADEKAKFVAERCTHVKRKGAACRPCIANAIMQYEVYAAKVQKDVDCAVVCPRCKTDPETVHTIGHPRTSHRVFPKHRKPPYKNDWRDVRCLAAHLHAAWDHLRR
jgi:hypothetical protein